MFNICTHSIALICYKCTLNLSWGKTLLSYGLGMAIKLDLNWSINLLALMMNSVYHGQVHFFFMQAYMDFILGLGVCTPRAVDSPLLSTLVAKQKKNHCESKQSYSQSPHFFWSAPRHKALE